MAKPEKGLEKWELRKLNELNIASWTDATDAKNKMREAMKKRAKDNEAKKAGGFAAVDTAAVKPAETKTDNATPVVTVPSNKIEVLPASTNVDVAGTQLAVHVHPANAPPYATHAQSLAWKDIAVGAWSWVQAFVIGAATWAFVSSKFGGVVVASLAVQ